jgi:hypothetical protein
VSTATRQRLLTVDYVETRGVVSQRLTTEAFYLIAWLKFPMPEDSVPLAALARKLTFREIQPRVCCQPK